MADPKKSSTPQPIFASPSVWRENVRDKAVESLRSVFPFVGKKYTVDVDNVRVRPMDYGPEDYKRAIMTGRTLSEPVKGTLILRDSNSGKTLQRIPDFNLIQLPYYTAHHTFILDGNPVTVNNQLRMKPGVYARKKRNEELEAQFNISKGVPFRMTMDPESGHFHLEYQSTRIPLYSVLNKLGVPDQTIARYWNPGLTQANRTAFGEKVNQHFNKFYEKAVRPFERVEGVSQTQAVTNVLKNTKLDPFVTKELLGKPFDHVTPETLLTTSQKLLRAYNSKTEFDERDNLAYKRILGADDFIAERIRLDARDLRRKFLTKLEYGKPDLTKAIPSSPFTKGVRNFLSTTQLKGTITQINPLEIMDSAVRITAMGEGGISNERGVPQEARYLHGTHMAAIDPVRTPESHHAGIEVRAALFMGRDRDGNIYTALKDRTGRTKYVPVIESAKSVIAFPDQTLKGRVDAMVAGQQRSVPAERVKYQVPHPNAMYTLSTNMIPFLDSIDGNRAEMGSKMVTQALPLKDAEPPLIQVASYRPGMTMEQELARRVMPTAPISGVVTKVQNGRVYIRPKGEKTSAAGGTTAAVPFFQNFPLNSKTYLHDELTVKPGDEVKAGQPLANSLYTRDGQLALGKNLRVAYVPLRGMNSNDAVVISESAAKKLTSMHMYKPTLELESGMKAHRETHRTYFGNKFQKAQYDHLDADGVIKPGTRVNPGDPLIAAVQKTQLSSEARLLGKLHKSLVRPYRDASVVWDGETPGVVTDVARTGGLIRLTVKTEEPVRVGDKLCFTEDTDVLTTHGWKPVAQVTLNDVLYTLNPKTNSIELHEPSAVHSYPSAGKLYTLRSRQVDLRVTDNHKLYVQQRGTTAFALIPATEVIGKCVRHQKNGCWNAPTPEFFELPKSERECTHAQGGATQHIKIPIQHWLRFLGIYLANGSTTLHGHSDQPSASEGTVNIYTDRGAGHSVPGDQYAWTKAVLAECEFDCTEHPDRFVIHSKQLAEYLHEFGCAQERHIPECVFSYGKDAAQWLMEGLLGCAERLTKSNSLTYTTVSSQLADDMQRLALHAGWAANITITHPTNPTQRPKYNVHIMRECTPEINHGHRKRQRGQQEAIVVSDEPVYGVTVPNSVMYVRVNGKPVWTGNSGRYGNKGVVSAILPDEHMLQDEKGRPIDMAISPTSVVTRINPAQILETALARVAEKTGKPIAVDNFAPRDNVQYVKSMLKKHNLKDTETLIDPTTGKKLPNILVGPQYTFKLMKTTSTNFSARGIEDYDVNQQPSAGGPTGAKGMGRLEFNALLAHNARNILRETAVLKSQKNDEWWRAYQLGLPPPPLKTTFAYDKFGTMLAGAGIKMNKRDNFIGLGPLTDRDVSKMSAGAIKTAKFVRAKDLEPERGGLFDPVITGGPHGTKWSHIELQEPMVNPVFEKPVKTLLGLKQKEFDTILREEGGAGIKNRLAHIDVNQREKEALSKLKAARADKRDGLVKELKYLRALRESGIPPNEAYVISKVPVIPPVYRPIVPGAKGQLQVSDPNYLLRDTLIANELLAKTKGMPSKVHQDARAHLYDTIGAMYGMREPTSPQLINRNVQGYLARIAGVGSPKAGFFHSKLLRKPQDISGRGTIAPDATLAMDEVGLPEDAGWAMYSPFVIRNLVNRGYKAMEAKKLVEEHHPVAKDALQNELRTHPVLINRAPSLYRFNILAAFPKLVPGKTIRVPEALAPIQSGDFDGDAVNITVPVTPAAIEEARQMTLPNMLLSDQYKFALTKAAPQQEAVLGIYKATSAKQTGKPRVFETKADAMRAYNQGEIGLGTPVIIKNSMTKISSPEMDIFKWCPKRS